MRRPRDARAVNGRPAVQIGKLTKPCPICGVAVGWRCTKTVGLQKLPRTTVHKERL